jgi:hypothetical protein
MFISKIKIALATAFFFSFANPGLRQPTTRAAVNAALDVGSYHVTLDDVLSDDYTIVSQLQIWAPSGSTVELFSDDKSATNVLTADLTAPTELNDRCRANLVVFADQFDPDENARNDVKFLIGFKTRTLSTAMSNTKPIPDGAKKLSDLLAVHVKSGEYKFGESIRLATYNGVTYSFLVKRTR